MQKSQNNPAADLSQCTCRNARLEEIFQLRWDILRPGLPRGAATFEGDDLPQTRHFACVAERGVISCVSLMRSEWEGAPAWQLRGMAVDETWQSRGVGSLLLGYVERQILDDPDQPQVLWCNAREQAQGFYERNGWETKSLRFDVPGVGPHFRMVKKLRG